MVVVTGAGTVAGTGAGAGHCSRSMMVCSARSQHEAQSLRDHHADNTCARHCDRDAATPTLLS